VAAAQVAERVPGLLAGRVAADDAAGRPGGRRAAAQVVDDVGDRERAADLGAQAADDGEARDRQDVLGRAARPDRLERPRQVGAGGHVGDRRQRGGVLGRAERLRQRGARENRVELDAEERKAHQPGGNGAATTADEGVDNDIRVPYIQVAGDRDYGVGI
jgi:hypothetical protein